MDLTAAILAGGLGTRLRPVVGDRPKVLAEVRGRPYLVYLLEQLAGAGAREVVLLVGYRGEQVRAALGEQHAGLRLLYAAEPSPLGTGGAVRHALPLLDAPAVLVMNGDSYCDVDLPAFREFHRGRGAGASMVLARVADAGRFGRVRLGPGGRVRSFEEKRRGAGPGWVNAGLYLLNRCLLEAIPPARPVSLERDVFPTWAGRADFLGFRCRGRFLDIGTPESYAEAATFFRPFPGPATAPVAAGFGAAPPPPGRFPGSH